MTEKNMQIKPYPLGAHCEGDGIRFSFVSKKDDCGIIIYDRKTGEEAERIPFVKENRIGNVHCAYVTKYKTKDILYQFYEEERIVADENAVMFGGKIPYGQERDEADLKAGFLTASFDWQGDENPRIPYEDCVGYLLHVRGFTKHPSSKVKASYRGTFRGIIEKIPYLFEIGITTVEIQPTYEFLEIPSKSERLKELSYMAKVEDLDALAAPKLNYWGYKKGYYYMPKAAYAAGEPDVEFKELVRELHKHGMELVMQFYFPREVSMIEIPEILRFWVMEYHVDGFHLMGENLPVDTIASDPVLTDTKLWYYSFHTDALYQRDEQPLYCNLAFYRDDYMYDMRKFLKGDEDMVKAVMYHLRHIPDKAGRIHFMSNYFGLTLMDMVSYERKHNEDNGEENRDGNDYNCSWNCGEEGVSRKKKISALRLRQLKNALCMILFSQSTPMIFMGDEFGNSQKGNNNPYCQDNTITWLDWKDLERNEKLNNFWKQLITLRKCHPVLHQSREPRIMDYIACGYPDLSYHGQNAWRPQTENYSRCIGIMYCGKYAKINHRTKDDDFFYIAFNMHWEEHKFGLPKLPRGMRWELLFHTGDEADNMEQSIVPARSVAVYHSVMDDSFEQAVNEGKRITYQKIPRYSEELDGVYADRTIF
uniref:alpha-amylase family glycosyl hydrolase n=1 Tax=Acetatifactor sp. TaxID=1872090 RepID=UPI004055E14F